ncbi:Hypothetical predicted protein [Podarcis lilfordi]|uniref:Uncharacterized protein n=1 Tax=Podarcis lilfordi TaxID=74358 RepID=A0AA35P8D4_9SAUR|nr:Hypothetical predicted protein [Podarcis lilfordi]
MQKFPHSHQGHRQRQAHHCFTTRRAASQVGNRRSQARQERRKRLQNPVPSCVFFSDIHFERMRELEATIVTCHLEMARDLET